MIKSIKNYFENVFQVQQDDPALHEKNVELATAVLMIEISLADEHFGEEERTVIHQILKNHFNIGIDKINELIEIAEKEVDHAVSLYEFTHLLNDNLSMEEKVKVIENLWHVAYADSVLDKYEEYYIRKVADLLYVSHSDYIKAKHNAAGN